MVSVFGWFNSVSVSLEMDTHLFISRDINTIVC